MTATTQPSGRGQAAQILKAPDRFNQNLKRTNDVLPKPDNLINYGRVRTLRDDMSLELEPMMAALNALARDTPRSAGERVLAADEQIKAWIAQTKDLSERQRMLRDLDGKVALQEVDEFSTMLRAHVAQLLAAIRNLDLSERDCRTPRR
jgi:hypothetical protein